MKCTLPTVTHFPYTTLFRSSRRNGRGPFVRRAAAPVRRAVQATRYCGLNGTPDRRCRSEEHTSELQSRLHIVCRLLPEKKKRKNKRHTLRTNCQQTRQNIPA